MAKTTKKTTSTYRKRYRYYFRRKYANSSYLNYYKAKINFSFSVFKLNNDSGSSGVGFRIGTLTWQSPGDSLNIADVLRTDPEYQLYIPIFNEVRLTGISIQAWPSARNQALGTSAAHVPVGLQFRYDQLSAYNNPLMLNPIAYCKKYWKNRSI